MRWKQRALKYGEMLLWGVASIFLPDVPSLVAACVSPFCARWGPAIIQLSVVCLAYLRNRRPRWDGVDRREQ